MSKVSIITRTHSDRTHFLSAAARSIREQIHRPIEWIVVDDGGRGSAKTIVDSLRVSGIKSRYIPIAKAGRSTAANVGLEHAIGDYIGFFDDDDELYPNHIAVLANMLDADPAATAAYSAAHCTPRHGQVLIEQSTKVHFKPMASSALLLETNPFPIQALLFRKGHIGLTRFNTKLDALEDWLFWIQLLLEKKIVWTPTVTSRYFTPATEGETNDRISFHLANHQTFRAAIESFLQVRGLYDLKSIATAHDSKLRKLYAEAKKPALEQYMPSAVKETDQHYQKVRDSLSPSGKAFPAKNSRNAAFTSCTLSYLPKARVWTETFKANNPGWDTHILLNDCWPTYANKTNGAADGIVEVRDLGFPHFHRWAFGLDEEEMSCATRPFYFAHLFKSGYEKVLFFDPDIEVFRSVDTLAAELDTASVLLTPHLEEPAQSEDELHFTEMSVLAHGVFNLGFLGILNDPVGNRVVDFWLQRLERYCLKDHARGLWTDQKWFNLVPLYFDRVRVLKNKGLNAASWNIGHRPIALTRSGYVAGGDPLLFFHFSGVDSDTLGRTLERFQANSEVITELHHNYIRKLERAKTIDTVTSTPWPYKYFDNGTYVSTGVKRFYRSVLDHRLNFETPFFVDNEQSFYQHCRSKGMDWIEEEYNSSMKLRRYY